MNADKTLPFSLVAGDDDALLNQAALWLDEGRGVALATVVRTWGSAPRPVGSHLAVDSQGAFIGSVSGGCIEAAVIAEAAEAIAEGRPRILEFGVSDAQAWDVGLACGGAITIYVEPVDALFVHLQTIRRQGLPAALVTDLDSGRRGLFVPGSGLQGELSLSAEQLAKVGAMLFQSASGMVDQGPAKVFVRSYGSPWSLLLVGAVHIAQFLAPMARLAGFDVTVIDPRRAFASALRFGDLPLIVGWPDEVMAKAPPGHHTAIVTLTHDPKIDDPALIAALRSPAFFVGALGSRRTHAERALRLGAGGLTPKDLERIAAPVGLDLGGRAPAEIAVAVLAEIIGARYGRPRVSR